MLTAPLINYKLLEQAIDKRHHAMERFYDVELAKGDRDLNLELVQRLKEGVASREDEETALSLINEYY